MAEDTETSPVVIKLYSKPEVPEVIIDINNLSDEEDKFGSEKESCFSDFESDNELKVGSCKKIYVKKLNRNLQRHIVMERGLLQTVEATKVDKHSISANNREAKLVSPRKDSLSERQVIEETGFPQTTLSLKNASSPGTLVTQVSRGIQCDSSDLESESSNTNHSTPRKYLRKVIVLHKKLFEIPHIAWKNSKVQQKSCDLSTHNKSQKNDNNRDKELSFIINVGETSDNSLVKSYEIKECDVDRFVNSERTVEKSSPILYSCMTSCPDTPSQSLMSPEVQPLLLSSQLNTVDDNATIEEMEGQNLAPENGAPSYCSSKYDYSSSSVTSPQHRYLPNSKISPVKDPPSYTISANVSQECQSSTLVPNIKSAQIFDAFTSSETEAAQIMLDLFYSGNSTDIEPNEFHESNAGALENKTQSIVMGDKQEGPERRAETDEGVIADSSNLNCKSFLNQGVTNIQPPKETLVTENNPRIIPHNNHEIIGTVKTRCKAQSPQKLRKLAQDQKRSETDHEIRKTPSKGQEEITANQRSYKCLVADDTALSQEWKNTVGEKISNKLQARMQDSAKRSKRFQDFHGALAKSTKTKKNQILKKEKTPGRITCKANQSVDKQNCSGNKDDSIQEFSFTKDFHKSNDLSCISNGSKAKKSDDDISVFKDDEIEINYKAGKKGSIEARFGDGISYPFEQNTLFSALGLVKRHSPCKCKLQSVSPSYIAHRTRNITTYLKRMRECQVVLEDCGKMLKNRNYLKSDIPKCDQLEKGKRNPFRKRETSHTNLYSPVRDRSFEGFLTSNKDIVDGFDKSELEIGEELKYSDTDLPQNLVQIAESQDGNLEPLASDPKNTNIQEPRYTFRRRKKYEGASYNRHHPAEDSQQSVNEIETDKLQKEDIPQKIDRKCNSEQVSQPVQVISDTNETYSGSDNPFLGLNTEQDERNSWITNKDGGIRNDEISYHTRGSFSKILAKKHSELEIPKSIIHTPDLMTASKPGENDEDLTRNSRQKNNDDDQEIHNLDLKRENYSCTEQENTGTLTKEKERTDDMNLILITDSCQRTETEVNLTKETDATMWNRTLVTEDQSLIESFTANCRRENLKETNSKRRTLEMTSNNAGVPTPNNPQKRKLRSTLKDKDSPNKLLRVSLEPFDGKEETNLQVREDVNLQSCDVKNTVNGIGQNHQRYDGDNRKISNNQQESFTNEVKIGPEQGEGLQQPDPNREEKKVICRRKKHEIIRINGKRWYPCSICNHKFSGSSDLTRHMRKHTGERPYKCSICLKSFRQKEALKKHIQMHNGNKPYACKICDSKFTQKIHLKNHQTVHTTDKPYRCEQCGKEFSRLGYYKFHMNIHASDPPYKCKICSRGFNSCGNLTKHKKIHDEEKHYKCQYCPAAFHASQSLKVHSRVHTGEKPIQCPLCDISYRFESSLRKHAASKHPEFEVKGVVLVPRAKK
ncbi:uncharacterized protein LOC122248755 [Penaeus japonicus]|uniref:uncharacterized protein LOC122248755 n=1 Tax=Penaeus japonicus TaxID=27405 RepID=UPI001C7149BB|nr:uncharacterized protein LOC122248755 [Penaeus japonicus]